MATLIQFKADGYSQYGEDGVLAEINKRLGITTGWFCEFGAADGSYLSNCRLLIERGTWNGVMIESHPGQYDKLVESTKMFGNRIFTMNKTVAQAGPDSLDALLNLTPIPIKFEVLSIDVDSCDYQLWASLKVYAPAVVIIEANSTFKPDAVHVYNKSDGVVGSSFAAMLELGHRKGYQLACHTGNMFFVRNDMVALLNLPDDELKKPESLYNWDMYKMVGGR